MSDWYSWWLLSRQREAELVARSRSMRIPSRERRHDRGRFLPSLRLVVGAALIHLGEAVGGERPAARACSDG